MLAILSPAKKLDFETSVPTSAFSEAEMLDGSQKLINKLKKLSPKKIGNLMSVSEAISELNFNRFQEWEQPFPEDKVRQALFAFDGEAYRGLDSYTFNDQQIESAQKHLRILSGLYGLLRPLDNIMAYRLEMGTKFGAGRAKNLYEFWKKDIVTALDQAVEEQGDDILVNVASNEYFKSVDKKKLKSRIITCNFKEFKNGDYKAIMVFAKRARGLMARYVITQNPKSIDDLKGFNMEGYEFNDKLSSEDNLMFTRG